MNRNNPFPENTQPANELVTIMPKIVMTTEQCKQVLEAIKKIKRTEHSIDTFSIVADVRAQAGVIQPILIEGSASILFGATIRNLMKDTSANGRSMISEER